MLRIWSSIFVFLVFGLDSASVNPLYYHYNIRANLPVVGDNENIPYTCQ